MVKRQVGQGRNSAPPTNVFLYVGKNIVPQPARLCNFFEAIQSLTKGYYNTTKDLTVTEAIPLRETMYSYAQQSMCFWNRYNVAWPC
jgi:hypothetical protein